MVQGLRLRVYRGAQSSRTPNPEPASPAHSRTAESCRSHDQRMLTSTTIPVIGLLREGGFKGG